jgi:hypothetical protein
VREEGRGMKTRRGYKDTGKKIYKMKGKIERERKTRRGRQRKA